MNLRIMNSIIQKYYGILSFYKDSLITMKRIVISANSSWNIFNFRSELIQLLSQFYEVHILTPDDSYQKYVKKNFLCQMNHMKK